MHASAGGAGVCIHLFPLARSYAHVLSYHCHGCLSSIRSCPPTLRAAFTILQTSCPFLYAQQSLIFTPNTPSQVVLRPAFLQRVLGSSRRSGGVGSTYRRGKPNVRLDVLVKGSIPTPINMDIGLDPSVIDMIVCCAGKRKCTPLIPCYCCEHFKGVYCPFLAALPSSQR